MDCSSPGSSVHGILQARILEWFAMPSSRGSFQLRSPTLQADSSPSEPPGKPKNTGVGSLSLLQGILPTQGLNPGLLHCRQILYKLSYQGSPRKPLPHAIYKYARRPNTVIQLCYRESAASSPEHRRGLRGLYQGWEKTPSPV